MACKSLGRDGAWGEADACLVCGGVSSLERQAPGPSVPTISLAFRPYVKKQSSFCENKHLGRKFCWEKQVAPSYWRPEENNTLGHNSRGSCPA